MYFWSVERLKAALLEGRLHDGQLVGYVVVVLVGVSFAFAGVPAHNFWSLIHGVVFVLSIVTGTLWAYRCNGGKKGRDFVPRFVSLAWVCAVRWTLLFVLPLTALAVSIPGAPWKLTIPFDPARPPLGKYDILLLLFIVPPLFWRVAAHMSDLARQTPEFEEELRIDTFAAEDGLPMSLEPLEE